MARAVPSSWGGSGLRKDAMAHTTKEGQMSKFKKGQMVRYISDVTPGLKDRIGTGRNPRTAAGQPGAPLKRG
jgi:hypothetical protein